MTEEKTPTRGEALEGIAFQFCKVATVALIAGKYTLPVAAVGCAAFYIAAFVNGVRTSRCILRKPLLIAAVYSCAAIAWWIWLR